MKLLGQRLHVIRLLESCKGLFDTWVADVDFPQQDSFWIHVSPLCSNKFPVKEDNLFWLWVLNDELFLVFEQISILTKVCVQTLTYTHFLVCCIYGQLKYFHLIRIIHHWKVWNKQFVQIKFNCQIYCLKR